MGKARYTHGPLRPRRLGKKGLTDAEILQDMRIAAQGAPRGALSAAYYERYGRYSASTVMNRFGSWNAALRLALPEVYDHRHPTLEQMIADLHRVADIYRDEIRQQSDSNWHEKTVRTLSPQFYNRHGSYGWGTIMNSVGRKHLHVNGWPEMLRALGGFDDLMHRQKRPTPQEMIADLHRVADLCRRERERDPYEVRSLSQQFYHQHGEYTLSWVIKMLRQHFGVHQWKEIKVEAGILDV